MYGPIADIAVWYAISEETSANGTPRAKKERTRAATFRLGGGSR
jgi:hypothetical protein